MTVLSVRETDTRKASGPIRRMFRWCRSKWAQLISAVLLVAAGAAAAGLYYYQQRPDQQTDAAAAHTAVQAASDGAVALLSYSPDSLDRDLSAAKSHLTGDFLSYYNQFTAKFVAPTAKGKGVKTKASVVQAAVSELHPDSAAVLLFIDQSTTSNENPEPALASSTVKVTLTKVNGAWLISKFDPV
jgi:Mce-associated membrane protein